MQISHHHVAIRDVMLTQYEPLAVSRLLIDLRTVPQLLSDHGWGPPFSWIDD
jgi:hypothetical protein